MVKHICDWCNNEIVESESTAPYYLYIKNRNRDCVHISPIELQKSEVELCADCVDTIKNLIREPMKA